MEQPLSKLAVSAVRLAAIAHFGPLAGGVFLTGSALAAKLLAKGDWAKLAADVLTGVAGSEAATLFDRAVRGFRSARNDDVEKSMREAAKRALAGLCDEASPEFRDWFQAWDAYLTLRPANEVFAPGEVNPAALHYGDEEFRAFWWSRTEPVLIRWRMAQDSPFTQLHLSAGDQLPDPLRNLLCARLPEAIEEQHDLVLRDANMSRSWIAFQQHYLREFKTQLDRIESKIEAIAPPPVPGAVWNILRPTHHFQDRPDLVAEIDRALERRGATALTALHGLAGIGKTEMARHYAELRRERYQLGAWVEAETTPSLLDGFAKLAPLVGVPVEKDQQALAARVMNALCAREPWLVVFDNAESAQALREHVQQLRGHGHVLITSRNEQWDSLAEPVSVTQWDEDESVKFLLERTGQTDRAAAKALAHDLDGLVLALEHAAALALVGEGIPLAEYHRIWREKLRRTPHDHEYPRSVAATLELSLDRVKQDSAPAYDLLSLFAWLAPDRIPKKELLEAGAAKLPETLRNALSDRDAWNELIETLGRYSLVKHERQESAAGPGYFLHRVVQQVMRDRLAAEGESGRWLAAACDVVDAAFPFDSDEPGSWPLSAALLPHARAIRVHAGGSVTPASLGRLLNQASLYLQVRGLYGEARDFRELALESALRQFVPDHPTVAVRRSNLAIILRALGEHQAARKQIELALESDLRQFGPDHPNVAVRRSNLANILRELGEHQAARKQIELALESDLRQFGPDHPSVAVRRSNLANILRELGEHQAARKQIELALESALRQFGPDHPSVAVRRSNLAIILRALGEHQAARKQIELALESDLRQFGPDHPTVAVDRSNLATILRALGEHQAARKQIELALESDLRQLGPDHPHVAVRRSNLATILRDLGEHQAARKQIELALESALRQFGPDHPNVAVYRSTLATILRDLGEHQAARKQIELALESALRQFGPDHPNVAVYRSNLATILGDLGEHQAALQEIEKALAIFRQKLPPGHPHIQTAEAWQEIMVRSASA